MMRDLSSQKKIEPEAVLAAIKSLQEKGWDINPYTVADEAKIPRSSLYRSPELMDLVSQARGETTSAGGSAPAVAADENAQRITDLEARNRELESRVADLEAGNKELQSRNEDLESNSREFESTIRELEARNNELANSASLPSAGDTEVDARVTELTDQSTKLQNQNAELQNQNAELQNQNAELAKLNETLIQGEQEAWQAGYQAAVYEMKKQAVDEAAGGTTGSAEPIFAELGLEPAGKGELPAESTTTFEPPVEFQSYIAESSPAQPESFATEETAEQSEWTTVVPPEWAAEPSERTAEQSEWAAEPFERTAEPSERNVEPSEKTAEPSEKTAEPSEWGEPRFSKQAYQTGEIPVDQIYRNKFVGGKHAAAEEGSIQENASSSAPEEEEILPLGDPPVFTGSLYDEIEQAANQTAAQAEECRAASDMDAEKLDEHTLPDDQIEHRLKTTTLTEDELRDLLKHRFGKLTEDTGTDKVEDEGAKKVAGTKFVGSHRQPQEPPTAGFVVRSVPPDIRKACLVLGLRPEDLTIEEVHKSWKREMAREHPDQGGNAESAVYLNTAKDTLFRWLEAQAPKLGKKFGASTMQFKKPEKDSKPQEHQEAPDNPDEE